MASPTDKPAATIGSLVVVVVVVGLTFNLFVAAFLPQDGSLSVGRDNEVVVDNADEITQVKNTTGRAAYLSRDAEVQISGGIGVAGEQWHWSTWVAVENTSRDQTIWGVRDEWILAYNGTDSEWVLWHYNKSSTNSYRTTITADTPGSLTNVQVARENATVTLFNASGSSQSFTLDPDGDHSAALPSYPSLHGRLEETRTHDVKLNATQRQQLRAEPLQPVGVGQRDARLFFDLAGRTVAVDLRDAEGEIVGPYGALSGPRADGISGGVLARGVDYRVENHPQGKLIVLAADGDAADMPRIVVATPATFLQDLARTVNSALPLLALAAVIIAAVVVIKTFDEF